MYASCSSRFRLKTSASVCRLDAPGEPAAAGAEDDLRLLDEPSELRGEPLGDDDRGHDVARCGARRRPPPRSWGRDPPRSRRGRSPRSRRRSGRPRSPRRGCRRGRRIRPADDRRRSARRGRRAARPAADRERAPRPTRASGRGSASPSRGAPRSASSRRVLLVGAAKYDSTVLERGHGVGEPADLLRMLRREHRRPSVCGDRLDELPAHGCAEPGRARRSARRGAAPRAR